MVDLEKIVVSCSKWEEIVGAVNAVKRLLPPDERKRFGQVFSGYLAAYDLEGTFHRMNNRTVSQILADFQEMDIKPIATGEIDGVRFDLYGAPTDDKPKTDGE